jgi:hypothetical protein
MLKRKEGKEVTIKGFVTPNEWDDEDKVGELGISTNDDGYYVVEENKLWEELVDILYEDVEVTGTIKKDKNGTMRIAILDYDVLTEEKQSEDEDY